MEGVQAAAAVGSRLYRETSFLTDPSVADQRSPLEVAQWEVLTDLAARKSSKKAGVAKVDKRGLCWLGQVCSVSRLVV